MRRILKPYWDLIKESDARGHESRRQADKARRRNRGECSCDIDMSPIEGGFPPIRTADPFCPIHSRLEREGERMSERRFMEGWDCAPWHKPTERHLGNGVYVRTEYGSHYIAALLYALWRKLAGASRG